MMNPSISVIIRLYNGIEYLNETIDSVIKQEYTNWELIVGVNGHGLDGGVGVGWVMHFLMLYGMGI